jgi:hypothetical protein
MTGLQLYTYLQRRLGIADVPQDQWSEAELYDYLTEARDEVVQRLSLAAPLFVAEWVTLELVPGETKIYRIPEATADPLRCLILRGSSTKAAITPSAELDSDLGQYEWRSLRTLELATGVRLSSNDSLEGYFILHRGPIDDETTEAGVALPTTFHRAVGKFAAILALTTDEDAAPSAAIAAYESEMSRLELVASEYDGSAGFAFRESFLMNYGRQHPETTY